jgi:hypothetical protein
MRLQILTKAEFLKFVGPIGPRGQKIMRSANNIGNAGPHVRQTFLNEHVNFYQLPDERISISSLGRPNCVLHAHVAVELSVLAIKKRFIMVDNKEMC